MLDRKVERNLPLGAFPVLWQHLASYSFALLISSKNEGDHRSVKLDVAISSVSPAFLCARSRLDGILDHLDNGDFMACARKLWMRRGKNEVSISLLCGEFLSQHLMLMQWPARCKHIYQYSLKDQFRDNLETALAIVEHKAEVKDEGQACATPLSAMEIACLNFFKGLLQPGQVFSLPATLLSSRPGAVVAAAPLELTEVVASVVQAAAKEDFNCTGAFLMFEVLNVAPEKMVRMTPSHIQTSSGRIRVRAFRLLFDRGDGYVVMPDDRGITEIDLLPFCAGATFAAVCAELRAWRVDRSSTCAVAIPSRPARSDGDDRFLERMQHELAELVPYEFHKADTIEEGRRAALATLLAKGATEDRPAAYWLSFYDFQGVSFQTIRELIAAGAVVEQKDEFGDLFLAVRPQSFYFQSVAYVLPGGFVIKNKIQCLEPDNTDDGSSKLLLLSALAASGWRLVNRCPQPSVEDSEKVVLGRMPMETAPYFRALLLRDHILQRAPCGFHIFHGLVAAYYSCLVGLKDLSGVHRLGDEANAKAAKFWQALLKGSGILENAPAETISELALEEDFGQIFIPKVALGAEPHIPVYEVVVASAPIRVAAPVGAILRPFVVHFDKCTHFSRRQRAFVAGPWHGAARCRRYVFCHHFRSTKWAAAWLTAWAFFVPQAENKQAHYEQKPTQEEVEAMYSLL